MRKLLFWISALIVSASAVGQAPAPNGELPDSLLNIGGRRSTKLVSPITGKPQIKSATEYLSYYNLDEMATVSAIMGNSARGWSATYFVHGLYSWGRMAIPLTFSADFIEDFYTQRAKQYQTSSTYYVKVGAEAFYAIKKRLWLNLGAQIPLGNEKLANWQGDNVSTVIFGIYLSQSIRYMAARYEGFSFGVGLFQQRTSSKVISENYGVKVELGYKF